MKIRNVVAYRPSLSKRAIAFVLSLVALGSVASFSGCKKKEVSEDEIVSTSYEREEEMLATIIANIEKLENDGKISKMTRTQVRNAALVILLSEIAVNDEYSDIRSDILEHFKDLIDTDNMMYDFNKVKDNFEVAMEANEEVIKFSDVLPEAKEKDIEILGYVEDILKNLIDSVKSEKKDNIDKYFNILYDIFVEKKDFVVNGKTYKKSNATLPVRALLEVYGSAGAYIARNYISEDVYSKFIGEMRESDSKAGIHEAIAIMENGAKKDDRSDINKVKDSDVVGMFNTMYQRVKLTLNGKVQASEEDIKNLVNYLNIKYLMSDRVSETERREILGEFDADEAVSVKALIEAIFKYNMNNINAMVPFSGMLVDNYLSMEEGKIAKESLDGILFNALYLLDETKGMEDLTFADLYRSSESNSKGGNDSFMVLYNCAANTNYKYQNASGEDVEVVWANVSPGVVFVNGVIINQTLRMLPKSDTMDTVIRVAENRIVEGAKFIENAHNYECGENLEELTEEEPTQKVK